MKIIMPEYVIKPQPMLCGSYEAEIRLYNKCIGKSGRIWLYAEQPNKAANVYVEGGPGSDGFGGREITFPLVDGTKLKLKGPWHANANDMFVDTGVDIRDTHYIFGVIGLGRRFEEHKTIIEDIIYIDSEPVLGSYVRIRNLAKQYAKDLNRTVQCYSQSEGGSSCGPENPPK